MYATVAQAPYDMGRIAVEEAAAAIKHKPVKRSVNTGASLVTQQSAQAYFNRVQKKSGPEPPSSHRTHTRVVENVTEGPRRPVVGNSTPAGRGHGNERFRRQ